MRQTESPRSIRGMVHAIALAYAHLPSRQPEGHVERKVSLIRLLILFALLPILWWDVVSPETKIVLIGLTALLACYILGALIILPRLRGVLRQDVFLTIDILAIAALVWYTGGINSSLLFLFYLPVLAAAIRLELREAILSAVAVSGIVIWMWNVAEGGLPSLGSTTLRVGLFTGSSLVTALIFGIMAQESRLLKEHGRKNRELNDKLTESTDQLRRRLGELEFAYELSRKLAVVTDTAAVLVKVTEAAQHLLRAPYGAVFLTNHTAGDLDLAYVHGLTDRDAVQLMRVCAGKVTADTTSPVTVEIQDAPWLRAVCTPIILAGRLQGILCAGGDDQWHPARHSVAVLGHVGSQAGMALDRASLLENLQRLATAKPEARLFTRDQFDNILSDEIRRATQLGAPFAILNLLLADAATDLVHKRFAGLVLGTIRRADIMARTDGGALLVMLSMATQASAKKFVSRLLQQLQEDATLGHLLQSDAGPPLRAGIATFPDDAVNGGELIFAAQNAVESTDRQHPVVCAADLDAEPGPVR